MIRSPVKQQIRSRYGSIKAFEEAKGLRPQAVRDYLRGKSVSEAEWAVTLECGRHDLERPRLRRRRATADLAERERAVQLCERRIGELTVALERAVQALEHLRALGPKSERSSIDD